MMTETGVIRDVIASMVAVGIAGSPAAPKPAANATVHRLAGDAAGIYANSYLVETRSGVIVVDGRLLTSEGKAVRARVEATGKPLLAVLITHGHPDHYNGVTEIVGGRQVPVVATAGVDRVIRENDAAKEKQWSATFGAEWPPRRTFPNRVVKDGDTVTFGGLVFSVHDLGPGESHSDSYWTTDLGEGRVAFIGDAVLHGVHAYASDGHTTQWLANLERLRSALAGARVLYPGHGDPGGLELLDWQKSYLENYRGAVKELARGEGRLSDEQKKALVAQMKKVLPNDKLEFLIPLGADPVAAELLRP
jgi:glyoxylase-like metal-dependent hydrolase (beta-lactamase superfamily II)